MTISTNLFEKILLDPAKEGGDRLYIVSGYATATMASKHLEYLQSLKKYVQIELIVGMTSQDGISRKNHFGFQHLASEDFSANFGCRYIVNSSPVHSKLYSWFTGGAPLCCFSGSANYTQKAFVGQQREIMVPHSPDEGLIYFKEILKDTIDCRDSEVKKKILIYADETFKRKKIVGEDEEESFKRPQGTEEMLKESISLLDNHGSLPERSGLNWGQRPEYNRNPNQAYIRIPATIYRSDFFPERTKHFTVLTDDGKVMICVRAQENGKAIHTPLNNSLLGEYFRNRLGLPYGVLIKKEHLVKYGRTDLEFFKIDEETYFMDFSVS